MTGATCCPCAPHCRAQAVPHGGQVRRWRHLGPSFLPSSPNPFLPSSCILVPVRAFPDCFPQYSLERALGAWDALTRA